MTHDRRHTQQIGPFRIVRQLEPGRLGDRWLALNDDEQTTHVLHRLKSGRERAAARRLVEAIESVRGLDQAHILRVERYWLENAGAGSGAWIVTPYSGNHDGLVTLGRLARAKGGRLPPVEAERALIQVLEAVRYAHQRGTRHGPMQLEEVLVDRRGSLLVELYGLARRLEPGRIGDEEAGNDEVRSIVGMGYMLLTGLRADEPRIRAQRLSRRLDRRWDEWFDAGLDPLGGFTSAHEALMAIPSLRRRVQDRERTSHVQTVIGRVRRALRS